MRTSPGKTGYPPIGIRCDVNDTVATGHFMRCATIADGLRAAGRNVLFLSADEGTAEAAGERGFACRVLGTDWERPETETEILSAVLKENGIRAVLADSYRLGADWFAALRSQGVRAMYFDDTERPALPVDTIVNYSPCAVGKGYAERYAGSAVKLLLGPAYVPLRPQFCVTADRKDEKPGHGPAFLLTTGGTDPLEITDHILHALQRLFPAQAAPSAGSPALTVRILAGRYYRESDYVKTLCARADGPLRVELHRGVTDVASLMQTCTAGITPGSTTLYELCACGVPGVSYIFADNQKADAVWFHEAGLIPYAGDFREDPEETAAAICRLTAKILSESAKERAEAGRRLSGLIDGRGAQRLTEALCALSDGSGGSV
ncbi:MAG: hypothetical protein LKJ76_02505 [Lachnospiraceae bacterium]|nr:hypothetical protein [Lachnospiraceae bacterium]